MPCGKRFAPSSKKRIEEMRVRKIYAREYVSSYGNTRPTHILMAERAIGRKLPSGAHVHHVDENPLNASPDNLVICPDAAYHKLLHRRTDALNACGNANWAKCTYCMKYDSPDNLTITTRKSNSGKTSLSYHKICARKSGADYRAKLRESRQDWIRGPRSDQTRGKLSTAALSRWRGA